MESVIEKFNQEKHRHLIEGLPFSYFSHPSYADLFFYILKRNGEDILVMQDLYYPYSFPAIFLCRKKENWKNLSLTYGTQEDIEKIEKEGIKIGMKKYIGTEYFYSTSDFVDLKIKKVKKRVRKFEELYEYKLFNKYAKNKIIAFYDQWKAQKKRAGDVFAEGEILFLFHLSNLEKYNIKQVYVEVDKRLVGFAFGVELSKDKWISLDLKADYKIKGLGEFLQCEIAKMFSDFREFSTGTGVKEKGIEQYKEELHPKYKRDYYFLMTE